MSKEGAERAVVISALIVFGVYFYRHLTEGTSSTPSGSNCPIPKSGGSVGKTEQFLGFGTPANIGQFITAWGFTFFVISIIASAAPGLGGAFAILVATADLLGNGCQVFHDVSTKVGTKPTSAQQVAKNVPSGAPPGALQ